MPQCISAVAFPSWKLDNQLAVPPGNKNNSKSLPNVPSALKRKKKIFFPFCGNFISTLSNKEYNSEASEDSFCDAVLLNWWHNRYRFPERYKEGSEAGY